MGKARIMKLLFAFAVLFVSANAYTWKDCGVRYDRLHTTKLDVKGSPSAGSKVTVTASGSTNLHAPLTSGAWQVRIWETGVAKSTHTEVGDLMKAIKFNDPAKPTSFTLTVSFTLPAKQASGVFDANLVAVDQSKANYMCLDVDYKYSAEEEAMVQPINDAIVCGTGKPVAKILVRSHAMNAAKVDWCKSNSTSNGADKCSPCLENMPAQPANATITVGADADYFVFAFKKGGGEQELYPEPTSGDWPLQYDLQDPPSALLGMSSPSKTCTSNSDCPCSYCMNDASKKPPYLCHAPTPGVCCKTDKDCPGSYCVNYHGPPPYHCHGV